MDIKTWWAFSNAGALFINIFWNIYFLFVQLPKTEALLHDAKFIVRFNNFFGNSILGKHAKMHAIAMVAMMPKRMQRLGEVSHEAYLRIPTSLKVHILAMYFFMCVNMLGMTCFYFVFD